MCFNERFQVGKLALLGLFQSNRTQRQIQVYLEVSQIQFTFTGNRKMWGLTLFLLFGFMLMVPKISSPVFTVR